ncbi:MarR family winged helix-turn-helix transcriptional regulator [Arthrobacter sp. B3I4]|uniref:MarR family winged helix-turn-helix transcriptional regulator n=1 Tax=Arthrobacter sp. B3I4 TaxID=3042267 RepID=UPI002788C7E9|nr:MarR family transcriptional regulator [Arthrobacter sp. B3I4]MDQ0756409.1 DNA-binding MarR family transcriptional regulator [Arthrobacter sp. B3I4]
MDTSDALNGMPGFAGREVDAVMKAADVLLRVVAKSVAEVEDTVNTPQLRVLVLIHSRGAQNLGGVAAELGVHASNATRICDRLVVAGLLERRDDPVDRRYVRLELSGKGQDLVQTVLEHRRQAIAEVISRMPAGKRPALASALEAFASAAGGQGTSDGRFTLGATK